MMMTLSVQERAAVIFYNHRIKSGDTTEAFIRADNFTSGIFCSHPEGPVVDIGCGIGRIVPLAAEYGIRSYLGIDPAIQHIKYCRTQYPSVAFQQAEVRQLGTNSLRRLGGFILLNVLMHTPKGEVVGILKNIRSCLLKGAVGYLNIQNSLASFNIPQEMRRLTFSFYEMSEFVAVLRDAGFHISKVREGGHFCEFIVVAS